MSIKAWIVESLGAKRPDKLNRQLFRGSVGTFALQAFGTLLRVCISIVLARILGPANYGVFSYVLTILVFLGVPAQLGLPRLITRNVAVYRSRKEWGVLRGLLLRANQFVLLMSLVLILLAVGAASVIGSGRLDATGLATFWVALAILPFTSLGRLRLASLCGFDRVVSGRFPELVLDPFLFLVFVGIGYVVIGKTDFMPEVAMSLRVVAVAVAFVVGHMLLRRTLTQEVSMDSPRFETRAWARSALVFLFAGEMSLITTQTDILMLGMFTNMETVGVYKVVVVAASLVVYMQTAVGVALGPVVARLHSEGSKERLQATITLAARAVALCSLALALCLSLSGKWILGLLYGPGFEEGSTVLSILCFGQLVNGAMGPVGLILAMCGLEREMLKGQVVGAIVNVTANLAFIPTWGMEGAAAATALSLISWNVMLAIVVYQRLGLHPTAIGRLELNRAT